MRKPPEKEKPKRKRSELVYNLKARRPTSPISQMRLNELREQSSYRQGKEITMPTDPNEHVDVCYVVPPILKKNFPAMGVSLLKACLVEAGISCCIDYANFFFANAMGNQLATIYGGSFLEPLVEYLFNRPAGIENGISAEEALESYISMRKKMEVPNFDTLSTDEFRANALATIEKGLHVAQEETDRTAARILAHTPRIVGCSSTYAQRNASFAILKRVKELDPSVITVLGGYNMTGSAGLAALRTFKYIDCVFFGESDDIVVEATQKLLSGDIEDMPYGVVMNSDHLPDVAPHRIVENFDSVPVPDYDDFIAIRELNEEKGPLVLAAEASRGCWWGQKNPCKFCGVCGKTRTYRRKSAKRVKADLVELNQRYGSTAFDFADPIMPYDNVKELIEELSSLGDEFRYTGMVKANIGKDQVERMAEAGWVAVNAGIESLSDSFLKAIGKGQTAMQCVSLLKNCARTGIHVLWNMLYGGPDEEDRHYQEQLELIPKLTHLESPMCGACVILYARDSAYGLNPQKYGLNLVPKEATRLYCPDDERYINDVAPLFDDTNAKPLTPELKQLRKNLMEACQEWRRQSKKKTSRLDMARFDDELVIYDSRTCRTECIHHLKGLEKELYTLAEQAISHEELTEKLQKAYSETEVSRALDKLLAGNLMIDLSGCYLALALPMNAYMFALRYLLPKK